MNETSIMNSMKHLPAVAFTLLLAVACTTDNEEAGLHAVPLTFSTSVDAQTRAATELTTDNLTSVGVFACFTQGDFNAGTATPNFMYNQELKKEAAAWTYSPLKYWPNNENDKISFFAYAPRNAAGVTLCSNTNTGFPYLDYTVPTAEADQTDLLAATPLMNQSYSSNPATPGSIKFIMQHALTKITIYAKSNDLSAGKVVNSLSVTAPKSGRLTYKADGFGWSSSVDKSTYAAANTDVTIAPVTADENVLLGTFYLIPDRANSSLNITYTVTGSVPDNVNPPTDKPVITAQAFPDTYDWTPGTSIVYTVNIARTGLEVVAESSSMEWTGDVTNNIEYFGANDLKPGDYYYSDGSWSDGGLRMIDHCNGGIVWKDPLPDRNFTNPQTGATRACIGVVFSTRMSESDKARGWTHGYVMGLSRFDAVWTPNAYLYDTSLPNISILKDMYNDLNGYDNTYTIKNSLSEEDYKLKHPLFYSVTSFAQTRPTDTSEWFLPSIGQMWDLCEILGEQMPTLMKYRTSSSASINIPSATTYAQINRHLTNAGGSAYMAQWSYWFSSTEFHDNFSVLFDSYATNPITIRGLYKWAPDRNAPGKGFPAFAF